MALVIAGQAVNRTIKASNLLPEEDPDLIVNYQGMCLPESRKSDGSTAVSRRKVLLLNVIFEDLRKV